MAIIQIIPQGLAGQRLDRWLKNNYPTLPYSALQKWLRTGQIRLNGKRARGSSLIKEGDQVRLPLFVETVQKACPSRVIRPSAKTLEFLRQQIIFEDPDCCVINKPIGFAVQGGTRIRDYIDLYLKELCPENAEPLRLTHRLDKETSGLLLLAKNYQAARYFTTLFKQGRIQKKYLAIVVGKTKYKEGIIALPIVNKNEDRDKKGRIPKKEAVTEYRVLSISKQGFSLLELTPRTGRTHQLRIHCALGLECPILGDGKYGGKQTQPFDQRIPMHLHAFQITVPLQRGHLKTLTAPIPQHFQETLTTLFNEDCLKDLRPLFA
jgi:23S rRNA pseudouridine955/2504/2580 synthase